MTNDTDGAEIGSAAEQTARFMATMSASMMLQNTLQAIPEFDGKNLYSI